MVEHDRKVSVVYASESNGKAGKIWSHLDFILYSVWGMNKLFGKELQGWLLDVIFPDFWGDFISFNMFSCFGISVEQKINIWKLPCFTGVSLFFLI